MKNKKRLLCILVFAVIIGFFLHDTVGATSKDGFLPSANNLGMSSSQPKNFDKYPITNYLFDSDKFGIFDSWAYAIKAIANAIFLLGAYISYIVNYLLMACFKINIFNLISSGFDSIVWAVRDAVFTPLMPIVFPVIGIVIVFNAVVGKYQAAWRLVFNTLIVLCIAFFFLARPSFTMNMVNEMSEGISGSMLAGAARVSTGSKMSADDAVVNLGNVFWESTVNMPWQIIEFGDTEEGKSSMDRILKQPASSDERKELGANYAKSNVNFTAEGQVIRLVKVLFIGLVSLVLNLFVLVLAGLTVMLQFAAIISAVVMILAFLLALLPNMGLNVAIQSMYNTFSFLLGKVGMSLLLSLYFSINSVIYKMSPQYGWFFVTVMQILLIIAVVMYRKKILGFAYAVTGGQQQAINNIRQKGESLKTVGKDIATMYGAKKVYDDVKHMAEVRRDKKLDKELEPTAQEYLKQRYANEKRTAEEKAEEFNSNEKNIAEGKTMQPEYSDFVKQVDSRVDKGYTAFDSRDIDRTVTMMKELHKQGNDPKNLLTTKIDGRDDNDIKYSQRNLEESVERESEDLESRIALNRTKINQNIKSDKESKLYDSKIGAVTKTADLIRNVSDKTGASKIIDSLTISSRTNSPMEQLEQDNQEAEYNEMKVQQSSAESEERERAEERLVVNGSASAINIEELRNHRNRNSSGRNPITLVDTNANTTENFTRDGVQIGNSESIGEAAATRDSSNLSDNIVNTKNVTESVSKTNKVSENRSETHQQEVSNVMNEHKNIEEITERNISTSVNNTETINNTSNNTESISKTDKVSENVVEANNKNVSNVLNNHQEVKETSEHSINKSINNTETINNTSNNTEAISKTDKVSENVVEANNKNVSNVFNNHQEVKETSEHIINKSVDNTETINNTSNNSETINKFEKSIENTTQHNNIIVNNTVNTDKTINNTVEAINNVKGIVDSFGSRREQELPVENTINRVRAMEDKINKINKIINSKKK